MAKYELFRRDSGEIMAAIVLCFTIFASISFYLSYKLISMGARGEFEIIAGWSGAELYFASVSPGLGLAVIAAVVLLFGLPKIIHPKN